MPPTNVGLRTLLRAGRRLPPLQLRLIQARFQHPHRCRPVAMLAAVGLTGHDDPGRQMRQPDRALRFVHVLPAGTRRPIGIDAQVAFVHLNLDRVVHDRVHPHAGKARLPPRRRVERANPHQPMHPRLRFQPAIRVRAGHLQRRRLDTRLLALALLQQLDFVAMLLRPARVHAGQHLSPILRLGTTGAGVHLQKRIVGVSLTR